MGLLVVAVVLLTAALALADHGVPASARSGSDWTTWLLVAGAVAAVILAAWAFFAPDRPDGPPRTRAPDPESEPPTR